MSKKWFIIEGNIGSGKTTLINKLKEKNIYEVIEEPVDVWLNITGDDNKNLLGLFYEDPNRYAYLFQTMVFKTRLQSLDKPQEKNIRFSERSIWTDKYVFGIYCIESGKMNKLEKNCYHTWFDWLEEKFNPVPDGIIYVQTSPEKCLQRIKSRQRSEENSIPIEYLKELHDRHDNWINNWTKTPVLIINNEEDNQWENILNQVNNFINLNNLIAES
jgi:deoxyadenosine/deoxycytidine kinase